MSDPTPDPTPNPNPQPAPQPSPDPAPTPQPSPDPKTGNGKPPLIADPNPAPTPDPEPPKPYWPEDWREKAAEHVAAGDEKAYKRELKRLERISDPAGVYGMYREAEGKLTSGGLIKKPGKDAKPEEIAEFQKALGWPEKPEELIDKIKLENDAVIGDVDKPALTTFLQAVHGATSAEEFANKAANWYYKNQEEQASQLDDSDEKFQSESIRALKEKFGPSFDRRRSGAISALFSSAPGGTDFKNPNSLVNRLMAGRTADGKIIGNDPEVVEWLISAGFEINPSISVVEDGDQTGQSVESEIQSIEKRMREDRTGYFKDEKAQARYRELLDARDKIQARQRT